MCRPFVVKLIWDSFEVILSFFQSLWRSFWGTFKVLPNLYHPQIDSFILLRICWNTRAFGIDHQSLEIRLRTHQGFFFVFLAWLGFLRLIGKCGLEKEGVRERPNINKMKKNSLVGRSQATKKNQYIILKNAFLIQNQLEHKYFIVKTFLIRCFSGFKAEIYCLKSSTETEILQWRKD